MKILCFGDSNTYGYDPRSFFGDRYPAEARWPDLLARKLRCTVVNAGENGREIPTLDYQMRSFAQLLSSQHPVDLLIVMLGTNDLLQGNPAQTVCQRMVRFLEQIPSEREKILLIGPPVLTRGEWVPSDTLIREAAELNRQYKMLARSLGIACMDAGEGSVPLAFDGVHLTGEGHCVMARMIHEKILEVTRNATDS